MQAQHGAGNSSQVSSQTELLYYAQPGGKGLVAPADVMAGQPGVQPQPVPVSVAVFPPPAAGLAQTGQGSRVMYTTQYMPSSMPITP